MTRCVDSQTQVMVPTTPGTLINCGNCGQPVEVWRVPLRPSDQMDRNTITVLSEHAMPAEAR